MKRWSTNPLLRPKQPNWLNLPRDVTFMIISRLGIFQILTSAQLVCRQWWHICMDPLMWRTINMCNIGFINSVDFDLEKMCRHAIDRSCGLLEDISIEYFGSDDLLKYIIDSNRRSKKKMFLGFANDETTQGNGELPDNSPGVQFEKQEAATATPNWGEIYGIWECAKNQRSRNAFKRYLTEKEKKRKNDKSKGKKKHGRKKGNQ
ncbi:hypothetical protein PIB30_018455 [Stylosanthes scabra]|uniref:F-box domain-containing protein n=1 Tax=Stylosanthes scabra TaxID=79078 RepID=A0ABU6V6X9_9FABA|nr:hypothetical protein [Stylosanthes scabra]